MTAHAKHRPPSSAKRWLSCPFSAYIVAMYPHEETEQSLKGDYWHEQMETMLMFGTVGQSVEPDVVEAMHELRDYVMERRTAMGSSVRMYIEQRVAIQETGEFGTVDIQLVSDKEIEIIDEKSGYVAVHVKMNPQLMTYLLGAIALHGERSKYRITLHQPNYDHRDGPIRSYEVSNDEIDWFRNEIKYSMENDDLCTAGKHCKETYCPHRGACAPFAAYVERDLSLGWHPSEVRSISDNELAIALDAAEQVAGYRTELRAEAMRRIINMDRQITGYKVVKARRNRTFKDPLALVHSVHDQMGADWAIKLFPDLQTFLSALSFPLTGDDPAMKFLGTAKHVEDIIKRYAQVNNLPRGGWKMIYDNIAAPFIRDTAEGLTLEKEIDGRPAHKRGSEFGPLQVPASQPVQAVSII